MRKVFSVLIIFALINPAFAQVRASDEFTLDILSQQLECEDATTDKAPFYISDEHAQGNKIWENFRNLESGKPEAYIPRGSLVFADPELSERFYDTDYRVPVKVIQVNNETQDEIKNARGPVRKIAPIALTPKRLPLVEKGQQGFLDRRAMQPAGKYTFFVKKDSPLYKTWGNNPNNANLPLSLKVEDGKYVGKRCCLHTSETLEEPFCDFRYTFQLLNDDFSVQSEFHADMKSCPAIMESVFPVQNFNHLGRPGRNTASSSTEVSGAVNQMLLRLEDRYPGFGIAGGWSGTDETIDQELNFSGLRFLPEWRNNSASAVFREYMMRIPIDHETKRGPYNSIHYNPDDTMDNDAFLEPLPMCAFMEFLKKFEKDCGSGPDCRVQFGNMYHHPDWGTHREHGSGYCLDLRPQRTDYNNVRDGLEYGWGNYKRQQTQQMVDALRAAGATKIIFNDPKIKGVIDGSRSHNNHLHVCFNPKNQKVKDVCNKGIE
jgi:hypothetical protein